MKAAVSVMFPGQDCLMEPNTLWTGFKFRVVHSVRWLVSQGDRTQSRTEKTWSHAFPKCINI